VVKLLLGVVDFSLVLDLLEDFSNEGLRFFLRLLGIEGLELFGQHVLQVVVHEPPQDLADGCCG